MYNFNNDIKTETYIKKCKSILNILNDNELELLTKDATYIKCDRGTTLYYEGKETENFYFVLSGIVKIFKTVFENKNQIVAFAQAGDIIGYRSAFDNKITCSSAKVIEKAEVCKISNNNLLKVVNINPRFAIEIIKLTCKELGNANQFLIDIAQKTVRERLAEVLIILTKIFDKDKYGFLKVQLTREEIASMAGTSTESIIRMISEFKNDKYIDIEGKKIKILNEEILNKISAYN